MKYKAIIFDMDGTIIDTEHVWQGACRRLISQLNLDLHDDVRTDLENRSIGMAVHECCLIIKELTQSKDSVQELTDRMIEHAKDLYLDGAKFIAGFTEFYAQARNHDLKMGIATNADNHTLSLARSTMDLASFFGDHIYNPIMAGCKYKPEPDLYLYVAKQLDIDPSLCIAIEDSKHGINAARAAGMLCIGIGTSQDPEQIKHAHIPVPGYEHINLKKLLGLVD